MAERQHGQVCQKKNNGRNRQQQAVTSKKGEFETDQWVDKQAGTSSGVNVQTN